MEDADDSDLDDVLKDMPREKPREGLTSTEKKAKRQKVTNAEELDTADDAAIAQLRADQRKKKREEKRAKKLREKEKKEAKQARKRGDAPPKKVIHPSDHVKHEPKAEDEQEDEGEDQNQQDRGKQDEHQQDEENDPPMANGSKDIDIDLDPSTFANLETASTSASDAASMSPVFDTSAQHSSASSSSSVVPSSNTNPSKPVSTTTSTPGISLDTTASTKTATSPKLPKIDPAILQARLATRIAALRAARNADTIDGRPARNRQELIEARRRKADARKANQQSARAQARVVADAESEAARLRGGSGSPLWSPGGLVSPPAANHFEFGRVAFADGASMHAAGEVVEAKTRRGPSDAKTALEAVQRKAERVNGMDAIKRADVQEKERWLGARKRVQGERMRDDASLLKKTLKRKTKGKEKSAAAWGERLDGVKRGVAARQQKREDNLAARKAEKGTKGKKSKSGPSKKKSRPGFEGSFKASKGPRA